MIIEDGEKSDQKFVMRDCNQNLARTTYFYLGFENYCQSLRKGQIMNTQVA